MATANQTLTMKHVSSMSTTSSGSSSSSGPVKPRMMLLSSSTASTMSSLDPADLPVRKLTSADVPRAVNCLAAAFAQDAVARYFTHGLPDAGHWPESRRWRVHMDVMKYVVKAHLLRGHVVGIGAAQPITGQGSQRSCFLPVDPLNPTQAEALDAVALFMPPGSNMDDIATIVRSGLWRLHLQLSREARKRFFAEFFPLLHDTKLEVLGSIEADAAAWYLVYLGARPGARGKGCARRLVKSVTEGECDTEGRECYLESSSRNNLVLYRRLGFEVKKTITLQRDAAAGSVIMDIMVRKPKTAHQQQKNGVDKQEKKDVVGAIAENTTTPPTPAK